MTIKPNPQILMANMQKKKQNTKQNNFIVQKSGNG